MQFRQKKALIDHDVLLAKDALPNLATKTTLSVLDRFERIISGQWAIRTGRIHFIYREKRYGVYY